MHALGGLCKAVLAGGRDRKPHLQKDEGQGLCVASCYSTVGGVCHGHQTLSPPKKITPVSRGHHGWDTQVDATDTFMPSLPGSSHRTQMFCPRVLQSHILTMTCAEDTRCH